MVQNQFPCRGIVNGINKQNRMDVNTFSFIQLELIRERERERQRQKFRRDLRPEKEKCKVASLQNSSIYTLYLHISTDCTYKNEKKDMVTIIKIKYFCFCSFVVTALFVNLLYSSYLHFQKKLDNIMQECINAHITH
jgi:hypothetical protein